eukprot:21424-Heterococcus_DN1.PRE.3
MSWNYPIDAGNQGLNPSSSIWQSANGAFTGNFSAAAFEAARGEDALSENASVGSASAHTDGSSPSTVAQYAVARSLIPRALRTSHHHFEHCSQNLTQSSGSSEAQYQACVHELQTAIRCSEVKLNKYKKLLSDAGLTDCLSRLNCNPEALAANANNPPLVNKSLEVAVRLKDQQKELQTLQEHRRVRSLLQTLGSSSSTSGDTETALMAPVRRRHADAVALMKAQLQVELDSYLNVTPMFQTCLAGWQTHALKLRNTLTVDIKRTLAQQLCSYKVQLDALRSKAHALARVYYDMLPPDKKQSTNSEHVYAAVISAIDARCNVVHSVQQCVPQVNESAPVLANIGVLNAGLSGSLSRQNDFTLTFPLSVDAADLCYQKFAQNGLVVPRQVCVTDRSLLLSLPKLSLCKYVLSETDVLSRDADTVWIDKPNEHWSKLHHQFVLAAWT